MTRAQRILAILPFVIIVGGAVLATLMHARSGACCYATAGAILPTIGRFPRYAPISLAHRHPDSRASVLALAADLSEESLQHGAPWLSFGDVCVDDGGDYLEGLS